MMMPLPLTLFSRLTDYWHSLSSGTRDNIIGGLIVAIVLGVLTIFRKAVKHFLGRLLNKSSGIKRPTKTEIEAELEQSQSGTSKTSMPASQIPSLTVEFVERLDVNGNSVVERLRKDLMPKMNRLVALWGAGGVGKTAIAAEVANSLSGKYEGRIVWTSADGRDEFALTTLLDEVAEKLGRSDLRTLSLEHKKTQIRDLVAAAPTLIVLDNFETIASKDQFLCVEWLSTHTPCSTLITTRRKIENARNFAIEHMSVSEANSFLDRLIQLAHNSDAFARLNRDRIVQTAEANPLVLQWIVGQIDLAQEPMEVLEELSHGEGDAAQRVFNRSFNLPCLEMGGRATLLALSMFVPSATRTALAEVAGLGREKDKKRFKLATKNLAALWLIQTTSGGQRLAVEGLTRELARARLSIDSRAPALRQRFINRFLLFAESHSRTSASDFNTLEVEKDNIFAAIDLAVSIEDWKNVLRIAEAFLGVLDLRGYWEDAIRCNKQALHAAESLKDDTAIAVYSGNAGDIFMKRHQWSEARRITERALTAFRELGNERNVASALYNLGLVAGYENQPSEARAFHEEALAISKKRNFQSSIANNLSAIASLVQSSGDYDEARRLYNESLELKRKINDEDGIGFNLYRLGTVEEEQGNFIEARQLYLKSLKIERKLGHQLRIANCLRRLGMLAKKEGQKVEAAQFLREALSVYETLRMVEADLVRESLAALESNFLLRWLR